MTTEGMLEGLLRAIIAGMCPICAAQGKHETCTDKGRLISPPSL